MYMQKNSGPRTEPWGTPVEFEMCEVFLPPFISTYWFLFFKNDSIQLKKLPLKRTCYFSFC